MQKPPSKRVLYTNHLFSSNQALLKLLLHPPMYVVGNTNSSSGWEWVLKNAYFLSVDRPLSSSTTSSSELHSASMSPTSIRDKVSLWVSSSPICEEAEQDISCGEELQIASVEMLVEAFTSLLQEVCSMLGTLAEQPSVTADSLKESRREVVNSEPISVVTVLAWDPDGTFLGCFAAGLNKHSNRWQNVAARLRSHFLCYGLPIILQLTASSTLLMQQKGMAN